MKFISKIVLIVSMFYLINAFAEEINYSVKNDLGQQLGQMVIDYKLNGYNAIMNGKNFSVETNKNVSIATMGKLIITMPIDGQYWHNHVGVWRTTSITTSFGDKGIAKMFYAGMTPNGRLYREEIWLNNRLFSKGESIIDNNDRFVSSVINDEQGTLILNRM